MTDLPTDTRAGKDTPNMSRVSRPRPKRREAVDRPSFNWLTGYYFRVLRPAWQMRAHAIGNPRAFQVVSEECDGAIEEQDAELLWRAIREISSVVHWQRLRNAWRRRVERHGRDGKHIEAAMPRPQ